MLKMKRWIALASCGILLGACQGEADEMRTQSTVASPTPTTTTTDDQVDMKKLSEAFGHYIGRHLQSPGLRFDLESLIKGIRAGSAGESAPLSDKEYEEMMANVQERAFKEMSTANLKTANDFMDKNKQTADVVEIIPGKLQFTILQQGNGAVVEAHALPRIHYTGRYQDGTVFGTSEEMGGPITIPLDQTIPGFSKGITGMKEGEKRRLFVHPDLGYGTTGQLPPNELLIFDIEVIKANTEDEKSTTNQQDQKSNDDDEDDDDDEDESNVSSRSTNSTKKDR